MIRYRYFSNVGNWHLDSRLPYTGIRSGNSEGKWNRTSDRSRRVLRIFSLLIHDINYSTRELTRKRYTRSFNINFSLSLFLPRESLNIAIGNALIGIPWVCLSRKFICQVLLSSLGYQIATGSLILERRQQINLAKLKKFLTVSVNRFFTLANLFAALFFSVDSLRSLHGCILRSGQVRVPHDWTNMKHICEYLSSSERSKSFGNECDRAILFPDTSAPLADTKYPAMTRSSGQVVFGLSSDDGNTNAGIATNSANPFAQKRATESARRHVWSRRDW